MMNLRLLTAVALSLGLTGCASWWSSDKGPKPSPLPVFQTSTSIDQQWRAKVSAADTVALRPAVVGDSVFAAGADGVIARFDKGREVWRVRDASKLSGGVAADADLVVVGTASGELVAYGAEKGDLRWRFAAGGEVTAAPYVTEEVVVARVAGHQLVAIDRADGKRRWVYQRAQAPLSLRTHSGFARSGELIIAGFPGGKLLALTLSGGFPRWEATVANPKGSNELERMTDVVGDPVVRSELVCVASFQGRVACMDVKSGVVRWARDVSSATGVDADNRNVYVSDENGAVHAFELGSGATAWKQDKLAYRGTGRPLVVGKQLAVGDAQGWLHLLSTEDGSFVGRHQLDSSGLEAPMVVVAEQTWVAQTRDGSVYMLSRR